MPPRKPVATKAGRRWDEPKAAPLVLVRGPEEYLRELAVTGVKAKAREQFGPLELVELSALDYRPGELAVATSPSLFAEPKLVVLTDFQAAEAADADLIAYAKSPNPEACVIVVHGGGVRGKKALDAVIAAGGVALDCAEMKKDSEKATFVHGLLKQAGRRAEPEAVTAMLEAAGSDLRSLAAAARQLSADTTGTITAGAVHEYHGGKVEATTFQVADAALAGDATAALTLFRHAVALGLKGPELTGALAAKLRALAKVAAIRSGDVAAAELGMNEWQVRNAGNNLRKWRPEQLAAAVEAVANADFAVKGGESPANAQYVLEKALLTVALRR